MLTNGGSDAFGQRLDTNAVVLPDSLTGRIRQRLDSKASKSGSLQSIVHHTVYGQFFEFQIQS